jgi:hypothetical protein
MFKLQEKPSACKREHPALQNIKFLYFFFLYFLWLIFVLMDMDPDFKSRSGSTDLIESGSNLDPIRNTAAKFRKTWVHEMTDSERVSLIVNGKPRLFE